MPKQNPYKKSEYVKEGNTPSQTAQNAQPKQPSFDVDEILKKIKEHHEEEQQ